MSPFALTKLAVANNQVNPLVITNYNSLDSFVMNNRLRSNPPPQQAHFEKQAIYASISSALNKKILRRKSLKGKLDQIRSESHLKYDDETSPFITVQNNGNAERPDNF